MSEGCALRTTRSVSLSAESEQGLCPMHPTAFEKAGETFVLSFLGTSANREQPTEKSDALPPRTRVRQLAASVTLDPCLRGALHCVPLCVRTKTTLIAVVTIFPQKLKFIVRETFIAKSGAAACRQLAAEKDQIVSQKPSSVAK